jgi:hypothetical protein
MMGAKFEFFTYGEQEKLFGAIVKAAPQHHIYPGGSYGFRVKMIQSLSLSAQMQNILME